MPTITPASSEPSPAAIAALKHREKTALHDLGPALEIKISHYGSNTTLTIKDKLGNSDAFGNRRECPKGWNPAWWNPAHWTLHQQRVDTLGRTWSRADGTFVHDDFGFLVEVPQ